VRALRPAYLMATTFNEKHKLQISLFLSSCQYCSYIHTLSFHLALQ